MVYLKRLLKKSNTKQVSPFCSRTEPRRYMTLQTAFWRQTRKAIERVQEGDWMMEAESLTCEICLHQLDVSERRPRNLPCGHTLCTLCIAELIDNHVISCPLCRKSFQVGAATDLPANFGLLRVLEMVVQLQPKGSLDANGKEHMCVVHKAIFSRFCISCEKCVCQICAEVLHPNSQGCETFPDGEAIQKLKKISESKKSSSLSTIDAGLTKLEEYREQIKIREKAIMAAMLGIVTERQQVEKAVEEGKTAKEALLTSKAKVVASTTLEEITKSLRISREHENQVQLWSVTSLRTFPKCVTAQSISKWLEAGSGGGVYAVHKVNSATQYAELTLEEDRLLLHVLKKEDPPANSLTLPYDQVRSLISHDSALTFLDLSWKYATPGRVFIKLFGDCGRGRRFLLLCTGERGLSYHGVRFEQTIIEGGIRSPVLSGSPDDMLADIPIQSRVSVKKVTMGSVGSGDTWEYDHAFNIVRQKEGAVSQFIIYLKENDLPVDTVFGEVESGFQTVTLAATPTALGYSSSVCNCGVVIPMQ